MNHLSAQTLLLAAALLTGGLVAGCVPAAPVNPYPPVPAPLAETVPLPPVSAVPLVWQPGHWDWTGTSYAWTRGEFLPAEGHSGKWMPGWWSSTGAGWVWVPPHWVS
jgi:hypothetical protein